MVGQCVFCGPACIPPSTTGSNTSSSATEPIKDNADDLPMIISVSVLGSVCLMSSLAGALFLIRRKMINNAGAIDKLEMPGASGQSGSSPSISGSHDWTIKPSFINVLTNSPLLRANTPSVYLQNIRIERKLGAGRFAEVFLGVWNGTTPVALKMLKYGATSAREFENEMRMLMKLNHPNIVRFLGIFKPDNSESYLVMEYLAKGALSEFLAREDIQRRLQIKDLLYMVADVAAAMMQLEQKSIVHRDLGARNLLVSESDGRFIVKLADLGLSRDIVNDVYEATDDSTFPVKWSPPEVIIRRQYTAKSDVFSFGVVVWEIFEFGKFPWPSMSNLEASAHVLQGNRLGKPDKCPDSVYQIMLSCWNEDPQLRPNFAQIYQDVSRLILTYVSFEEATSASIFSPIGRQSEDQIVYNN